MRRQRLPVVSSRLRDGGVVVAGDRLMAYIDAGQSAPLRLVTKANAIDVTGKLAAGKVGPTGRLSARLAAEVRGPCPSCRSPSHWTENIEEYWHGVFNGTMKIDIPDPLLTNVIRASQVHCLLAARNHHNGRHVAPWIGSTSYGPLESESQAVIRGMDMFGHEDFARRSLDYFRTLYSPQGFLTTSYTLCGTGEHLWTLAEHQFRYHDTAWFTSIAPQMVTACKWIISQRAKTKVKAFGWQSVAGIWSDAPGGSCRLGTLCVSLF